MTIDEFRAGPATILDGGWPGDFTEGDERGYFYLLADFDAEPVMRALGALRRSKFRPAASEIIAALEPARAAMPTFDEALRLLFDRGGILDVRVPGTLDTNPNYGRLVVEKVSARLQGVHPVVAGFAVAMGIRRLWAIDIHDPDYGWARRDELRVAWDAHVEAFDGREVAALVMRSERGGLRQLDPLATLRARCQPTRTALPEVTA
jgi:hypothetical protein